MILLLQVVDSIHSGLRPDGTHGGPLTAYKLTGGSVNRFVQWIYTVCKWVLYAYTNRLR